MTAQLLAHCGANWKYCDGGSIAGGLFMLWLVRRSVKRAERKAHERRAARIAAGALRDIAARQQDQTRVDDPPLL
jgi:hypothetical protein